MRPFATIRLTQARAALSIGLSENPNAGSNVRGESHATRSLERLITRRSKKPQTSPRGQPLHHGIAPDYRGLARSWVDSENLVPAKLTSTRPCHFGSPPALGRCYHSSTCSSSRSNGMAPLLRTTWWAIAARESRQRYSGLASSRGVNGTGAVINNSRRSRAPQPMPAPGHKETARSVSAAGSPRSTYPTASH